MNKRQISNATFTWVVIGLYWLSMLTLLWLGRYEREWPFWIAALSVLLVLLSWGSKKHARLGEAVILLTLAGGVLYGCLS